MSASEARRLAPRSPSSAPPVAAPATPTTIAATTPPSSPNPTPLTDDGWQRVPDGKGGTALQRTITVAGGAAAIRFAQGEITVTATAPARDFIVAIERQAPDVAIVTFTSARNFSRIEATWRGGPRVRTTEGDT